MSSLNFGRCGVCGKRIALGAKSHMISHVGNLGKKCEGSNKLPERE